MLVQIWMTRDVITITPEASIAEAEGLMRKHGIRRLPVMADNRLAGIITPANINKGLPSITDPEKAPQREAIAAVTRVAALMTANPLTVAPDDTLERAAFLMRTHKIGGLPVVRDGELVGIISESNILDALLEVLGTCEQCARIELKMDRKPASFHELLDVLKDYNMDILSIAVLRNFSLEHKLVTLRVNGPDLDDMIEELWNSNFQITRVIRENENQFQTDSTR